MPVSELVPDRKEVHIESTGVDRLGHEPHYLRLVAEGWRLESVYLASGIDGGPVCYHLLLCRPAIPPVAP